MISNQFGPKPSSHMKILEEIALACEASHVFIGVRRQAGVDDIMNPVEIIAELFVYDRDTDRPTILKAYKV